MKRVHRLLTDVSEACLTQTALSYSADGLRAASFAAREGVANPMHTHTLSLVCGRAHVRAWRTLSVALLCARGVKHDGGRLWQRVLAARSHGDPLQLDRLSRPKQVNHSDRGTA